MPPVLFPRPRPIEMSPSEEVVVLDNAHIFKANGFHFKVTKQLLQAVLRWVLSPWQVNQEAPAGRKISITAIPFSKNTQFGDEGEWSEALLHHRNRLSAPATLSDVHELASLLRESPGAMKRLPKVVAMFASRACRSAIMIGKALGREKMTQVCGFLWFSRHFHRTFIPTCLHSMLQVVRGMSELNQPWNCPHGYGRHSLLITASCLIKSMLP